MVPCGTPVLPYLYLGGGSDASDPERLKSLNIYYVLNVTTDLPGDGESDSIRYKRIPAIDNFEQNLIQYFEECFQFIEEARKAGRSVLIHCQAGISRSPTIVIAYLMYSQKMSFNNAYSFVRSKREKINPNLSFVGQLCEYGDLIENVKNTLPASTTSSSISNESISSISKPIENPILITSTSSSNSSTTVSQCNTAIINSPFNSTDVSTKLNSPASAESHSATTTTTTATITTTTSISAPTTPTSPKPLTPPMPTTPIVTTLPITTIPTSRSYIKISDSVKKPFFLLPPPRPSNLSIKDGINKPDFPSSCEALSDIPYNSLGPVRGCRSRKSCTNDFILLRPIKMTKNTRVK